MGPDLLSIKRVTGVSRNQLSEALHVPLSRIIQWEEQPNVIPQETWDEIQDSFAAATHTLDLMDLTWDQVLPLRTGAMRLGVSPRVFAMMLLRRGLHPLNFSALGDWVTDADVVACRR